MHSVAGRPKHPTQIGTLLSTASRLLVLGLSLLGPAGRALSDSQRRSDGLFHTRRKLRDCARQRVSLLGGAAPHNGEHSLGADAR